MTEAPPERGFELDRYQQQAIDAFDAGESVLVAAPTGAGKTVVAEHAIGEMLRLRRRTFYTSPIKALANQKFRDFRDQFGISNLGLLTGDVTVNGDAPVVVMTTEVLRNMLYESRSRVRTLGCVVLDEVHYLQDRQRGPVWEEVLLNLPTDVRTVSLSATVSNLDEFVEWLRTVRGATELIVERERPVPLSHRLAVADRESGGIDVVPLLRKGKLAPEAERYEPQPSRDRGTRRRRGGRPARPRQRWAAPRRARLADELVMSALSPLIWFVFSRAGCDEAVAQCLRAGLRYTTADEGDELGDILAAATSEIEDDDWYSLGLDSWQRAFESGIASHHAGLIPALKEAVETAFAAGLLRVVFATETLALGVNLPARSVVLESLVKFNGETHEQLTPLEYTQLTGRAGRRGIDDQGTAVCCWSSRVSVRDMAQLAASRDFPLRSAFAPNYNMVANLLRHADEGAARNFVTRSFAQFQRDRSIVKNESKVIALDREVADAAAAAVCDRGDVRSWLADQKKRGSADDDELGQLRPGDIIEGINGAPKMVMSVAHRGGGVVVRLIGPGGRVTSHRRGDLASPIHSLGHRRPPNSFSPSSDSAQRWAQSELDEVASQPRPGVAGCPELDRHLEAIDEVDRLERKRAAQRKRSARSQGALVAEFDAVASILHDRDFVDDWELTTKGLLLAAVHGEAEAVLAEALHVGVLSDLDAPGLAATLSCLVYEQRGLGPAPSFRWPDRRVRTATAELRRIADGLVELERARIGRAITKEPDPGLVATVYAWASGDPLEVVLDDEVAGGDFVRSMRQVIDVCRQVAQVGDPDLRICAADAVRCVDRGVVRSVRDLAVTAEVEQ